MYRLFNIAPIVTLVIAIIPINALRADVIIRDPSQPFWLDQTVPKAKVKPVAKKALNKNRYTLNAVYIDNDKKVAMINDVAYELGQTLGPYKIEAIFFEQVVLRSGSGTRSLNLYPTIDKGFTIK